MEVTNEQLLDIFKAGFRVAESKQNRVGSNDVVATNSEIELDAIPIISNIIKRPCYVEHPRKHGNGIRSDLYKGIF